MIQGTTPTFLFKFSIPIDLLVEWRICFAQEQKENLIKTEKDCIVDENQIIYLKLSQEETFNFDNKKYIKLRVKALTKDNNVISSNMKLLTVTEMLDKVLFDVKTTPPTIIDTSIIHFEFEKEPCAFGLDFEDLYIEKVGGSNIIVDTELSLDSENPVQNKVVTEALHKNLLNVTIIDQDLSKTDFVPTPNTYYRHTNKYNTKYDYGTILFYNGTDYEIVDALNSFVSKWESTVGGYGTILVRSPNGKYSNTGIGSGGVTIAGFVPTYVQRTDANGVKSTVIVTGNPVNDVDATPKKWVEDLVASVGGGLFKYIHYFWIDKNDGTGLNKTNKIIGVSKFGTAFTYVQGKGILLGTFNVFDNANIYEYGISPEVLMLTSARLHDGEKFLTYPSVEYSFEYSEDNSNMTYYITKIEDLDCTSLNYLSDSVTEG